MDNNSILEKIKNKFADAIVETVEFRGELTVVIKKEKLVEICKFLRDDSDLKFDHLADVSGVDFLERLPSFDISYHMYSIPKNHRLRIKIKVNENEAIPTVTPVWSTANWHEREIFDMFGLKFDGHPDLRRILMADDWVGHPLRKDYPLGYEEVQFTFNKDRPPELIK